MRLQIAMFFVPEAPEIYLSLRLNKIVALLWKLPLALFINSFLQAIKRCPRTKYLTSIGIHCPLFTVVLILLSFPAMKYLKLK
jgi:hypothetical protein